MTNLNDTGVGSLRFAIIDANNSMDASSTITFNANLSGTISLQSALDPLQKDITIRGPSANQVAVARDAGATTNFSIFPTAERTTCEIDYLYIEDGNQGGIGSQGSLTLYNCFVGYNTGGSGVSNGVGKLNVENSIIEFNQTSNNGGGIDNVGGTVFCYASTIDYNNAKDGGGIANDSQSGSITLTGSCDVSYNYASEFGGGIYNPATLSMTGGWLSNNTAASKGGGLYQTSDAGKSTFTSVQITYNQATGAAGKGGGFYLDGGAATFNTCTISNNTAATGAGGAWVNPGSSYTANGCTITDPIVPV